MPKVAVAFSGGGLRAMLSCAGVFDGLDSRSTTAKPNLNDGKPTVNGLLDWASYMTGTPPYTPLRAAYLRCLDFHFGKHADFRIVWWVMVDWCFCAKQLCYD